MSDRLQEAPIGTRALAINGGHWVKTKRGWKWCTGDTFPTPGGDWNGKLIYPATRAQQLRAATLIFKTY